MLRTRYGATLSIAVLGQLISGSGQAQESSESSEVAARGLEQIVVTAQRRTELLQDVPISVTALTASTLSDAGIATTEALLQVVPSLNITRTASGAVPFIRGVGTQDTTIGNESGVATYVDGVYYMAQTGTIFSFNNIERVEVLKGPQGTLFGRNATGGLINVITRDPVAEPGLEGSIAYGKYDTVNASLYATGGVEAVAADLAVYRIKQNEGFGRNLVIGDDINMRDETAVRSKVLWTPSDASRITFSGDWSEIKTDLGLNRNAYPGSVLIGGVTLAGSTPYDTHSNFRSYVPDYSHWGASLRYEHEFDWAQLTITSAYRDFEFVWNYDQDAVPARLADIVVTNKNRSLQNEILLVGSLEHWNWTAGLFALNATSKLDPLRVGSISPRSNFDLFSKQDLDSYAGFAEVTWSFTERTQFTAGARYTEDTRDLTGEQIATVGNPAPAGTVLRTNAGDATFSKVTWRASLDHKFTDDVLGYISLSRGFKSGLFNQSSQTGDAIRPETIDAVEVGAKSELLGGLLRLNAAAFYYEVEDLQVSRSVQGGTALFNAAESEIKGFDAELQYAPRVPVGDLQLSAGLSLLDASYTSFPEGVGTTPNPTGGNITFPADLSGNDVIRSPDWTVSLGADYRLALGSGELAFNISYYHNDGFAWDSDNRLWQDAYDLVNARASYSFGADQRYRVSVYGENLTDEIYYIYVNSSSPLGDAAAAAAPRIYGVALDFRF